MCILDEEEDDEENVMLGRFPTNKPKSPDSPRSSRLTAALDTNGNEENDGDTGFIELKRQPNVNLMDLSKTYYDV